MNTKPEDACNLNIRADKGDDKFKGAVGREMGRAQNKKAVEVGNVFAEALQVDPIQTSSLQFEVLQRCIEVGCIPYDWSTAVMVLIYSQGN